MKKAKAAGRKAKVGRSTRETDISLDLTLDGTGKYKVVTGISFMDHMLELMFRHGLMDAKLEALGDLHVDDHHTVEDVGLVLGEAIKKALGKMEGIRRYGSARVPMDEALAEVSLDISGRPFLVYDAALIKKKRIKAFDVDLVEDFLQALVTKAGMTLHVSVPYGRNTHHMVEAVFKALGRAIKEAVEPEPRGKGVPSTKGRL